MVLKKMLVIVQPGALQENFPGVSIRLSFMYLKCNSQVGHLGLNTDFWNLSPSRFQGKLLLLGEELQLYII
jgi:hypothetical protein